MGHSCKEVANMSLDKTCDEVKRRIPAMGVANISLDKTCEALFADQC